MTIPLKKQERSQVFVRYAKTAVFPRHSGIDKRFCKMGKYVFHIYSIHSASTSTKFERRTFHRPVAFTLVLNIATAGTYPRCTLAEMILMINQSLDASEVAINLTQTRHVLVE